MSTTTHRLPKSKADAAGQISSIDRAIKRINQSLVAAWVVGDPTMVKLLGHDLSAAYEAREYYATVAL